MKQNHLILHLLIALSILSLNISCQEQARVEEELESIPTKDKELVTVVFDPNQPSPRMKFETVTLNFNKVGPGTKSNGEFKFTNTGEGVLKITKVAGCCGVVTKLEKDEYAPGESGVLKVTYNASVQIGKVMRQLVVHSNDKTNPGTRLTIKAEIVAKISILT